MSTVYKNVLLAGEPGEYQSLYALGRLKVIYKQGEISRPHPEAEKKGHGLWCYRTRRAAEGGEACDAILECYCTEDDIMLPCVYLDVLSLTLELVLDHGGEQSENYGDENNIYVRKLEVERVLKGNRVRSLPD
jgi:hypothetical protein